MMNYVICTVKPVPCSYRPYELFYLLCALVNKSDQSACRLWFVQCQNLTERLKSLVNSAPVMVFMKGSPAEPRCGVFCVACWLVKCQTQTHTLHVVFILCIVFVLWSVLSITLGFHITTTELKVKEAVFVQHFIMSCSSLRRSSRARANEGSHSFMCHARIYPQVEWTIPAFIPPPQITALWLVLIFCPAEGRRLSWPGWLSEGGFLPKDDHPSPRRPWVELATVKLWV